MNEAHTRLLAESESELPPILVHRATMQVIDGMHRLRVAQLKGQDTIAARFFDGPVDLVFALAVEANITHGMPLSLQDREVAAARIVREHPEWSDRVIAGTSGLSSKTVGAIRRKACADIPQVHARLGRDGRLRPMNSADGRERASAYIARNPEASLREIAREAGISPSTARDVRARLERGEEPVPPGRRPRLVRPADGPGHGVPVSMTRRLVHTGRSRDSIVVNLSKDPSLRFNDSGRQLLRWLDARAKDQQMWEQLVEPIPTHCSFLLAELAQSFADSWLEVADRLKDRLEEAT
ncbi:hypothetical protein ACQP1W_31020 [Spirillospora sp. CA-255316]